MAERLESDDLEIATITLTGSTPGLTTPTGRVARGVTNIANADGWVDLMKIDHTVATSEIVAVSISGVARSASTYGAAGFQFTCGYGHYWGGWNCRCGGQAADFINIGCTASATEFRVRGDTSDVSGFNATYEVLWSADIEAKTPLGASTLVITPL